MSLVLTHLRSRGLRSTLSMQSRLANSFNMVPDQSQTLKKEFWDKNKELQRPISPHLGIYKIQMTNSLSILHRATGVGIGVLIYAGGISSLFASGVSFPEVLQVVQDHVPHFIIIGSKAAVGGGLIYHTLCGVRHLVWDMGYGFQLKQLYLSGYVVIALTGLGTVMILLRG